MKNIERLLKVINRSLFTVCGHLDYDRITDAIILLCDQIESTETDESLWWMDCNGSLDSLIVGAYWHYTEWHNGQNSKGYLALSKLGQIFNPGMSHPEPDNDAYQALAAMAA